MPNKDKPSIAVGAQEAAALLGQKGGRSRSPRKVQAARLNAAKAAASRKGKKFGPNSRTKNKVKVKPTETETPTWE